MSKSQLQQSTVFQHHVRQCLYYRHSIFLQGTARPHWRSSEPYMTQAVTTESRRSAWAFGWRAGLMTSITAAVQGSTISCGERRVPAVHCFQIFTVYKTLLWHCHRLGCIAGRHGNYLAWKHSQYAAYLKSSDTFVCKPQACYRVNVFHLAVTVLENKSL